LDSSSLDVVPYADFPLSALATKPSATTIATLTIKYSAIDKLLLSEGY
jgi:hypothetical protein